MGTVELVSVVAEEVRKHNPVSLKELVESETYFGDVSEYELRNICFLCVGDGLLAYHEDEELFYYLDA